MDWINPNDRLPPPGDDVLVCVNANPGRIRTAYYVRGRDEWFNFGHRADNTPTRLKLSCAGAGVACGGNPNREAVWASTAAIR